MPIRYPSEERQTGEPANQQTGRVDEVCPEVQNFRFPDSRIVQDILDVSEVSTRAEMDEDDSKY